MSYVYAITDRPEQPLPGRLGLNDTELAQIAWRGIGAVVSTHNGAHLAATADELWRHEEVVEALMAGRAVLPARFGTLLPSHQRVGDMLCRAYPQFVQDLDRVRGHVEIGIRFLARAEHQPEAGLPPARDAAAGAVRLSGDGAAPLGSLNGFDGSVPAPGTAYLRAKLAKERALRHRREVRLEMVREVYTTLASHATASRLNTEPVDRPGVSAAFLVPRDRLGSFRAVVGLVADTHPELALLCTGPWPAYSFVNANAGEPATSRSGNGHAH